MDKLAKLIDKLKKLKYSGKIEIHINSGGIVGINVFKKDEIE
jgi:hypothetical protein